MASGAGLNRASTIALSVQNTSLTPVSLPGHGTIGLTDSGLCLPEARDFTKWTFTLLGDGAGWAFTCLGTNDPQAYLVWKYGLNPQAYPNLPSAPTLPDSSWRVLPGPSEQSGTGGIANPLTSTTPFFQYSGTLVAVRVVLTAVGTLAGSIPTISVAVEATP